MLGIMDFYNLVLLIQLDTAGDVLKRTIGETEPEYKPTTVKEKQDKRNEMKARGTLLMALLNKDQLKFHSYKDAKLLMEAIKKRYGGNKESKKVHRTLLKQQYENFEVSSLETMDQTFDSNSSTNEVDNTVYGVSAAHTQSNPTSGDNLKQINPDDLEEMDIQWEMAMLTIKDRRFIQRTSRKLDVNGQRVGFNRTKVKCYNCHKKCHFARECRAPRNQENRRRENNRRTVTVETPTKNALVAQDGIGGYDWSYQAKEEHPTNFALMAFTSSGSSSSSDSEVDSCSKSCVKAYATLKEQYDSLSSNYKKSQFNLVSYKAGLESVEARLAHYKKIEVVFEDSINVLNLEVKLRDNAQVSVKFKTGLGYNVASSTSASPVVKSFVNSSKMLENQEYNKSKSTKRYHAVPPTYIGNFIPFKPDLMFMDEIVKSENMDVTTIITPSNVTTIESNHESANVKSNGDAVEPKTVRKNGFRPPVIEDWNFDDDSEVEFIPNVKDKTVRPSTEKIKFVKSTRETVEKEETPKQNKHYPGGNQRNWNNLMSQRLGSDFKMINKACFVCGSFEHLHYVCDKKVIGPVWKNSSRVNHKNFANKMTHCHLNRRFVPQTVLTRSGKINTAGASVNTVVRPVNTADSKQLIKDTTTRDRAVVSENKGKWANAVKASACWVWKAKNSSNPQQKEYKEKEVIDSGCSRHMTGNICYLTEYEDYDGGFVSFRDGKGRIFRKGKIKTGTLNFDYNGVAERKNRTLIEAARIMLVDSKLPTTFWAKAVNTACYVLNRVLVIKPHNKTPYEIIRRRTPLMDFMKPFGCHVTILNTRDHLGKFDGKANEGFFVGYSVKWTRLAFDVDSLTISMNYVLVVAGNQTNGIAGTRDNIVAGQVEKKIEPEQEYILIPIYITDPLISQGPKDSEEDAGVKPTELDESEALDKDGKDDQHTGSEFERLLQLENQPNSTNSFNTVGTPVSATRPSFTNDDPSSPVNAAEAFNAFEEHLFERFSPLKNAFTLPLVSNVTLIDDTGIFGNAYDDEDVGAETDLNNLETTMNVSPILTIRMDKNHPKDPIIGDLNSAIQTKRMTKISNEHAMIRELTFFLGLQVQQKEDGIFISQDKYVAKILKKFDFSTVKTTSTPIETNKAFVKDEEAEAVDVHLYRSMIGSLMYLTASRHDILYLKGQPKLGLWYPRDSPFDLEAFSDSDYARASLDRKSTTGGCQFLGKRLISWQCKKQTIVANSTTEAEYVAAANCCGQVLWIQNQMLDYGFNFMNTKIYIDNESTICIVKNLVFHSKTKHIEIRHHFIRDSYEKRLIQVIKIHTDHNVADLLIKAFDVSRFNFLVASIGPTIYAFYIEQFWNTATSKTVNSVKQIHAIVDGKAVVISESSVRNDILFDDEDCITCLTNDDIFKNLALIGGDSVERAITTDASLVAAQDSDNIIRTQTTAMPNVDIHQGMDTCGSPRRQETMEGALAQTRSERVLEKPNEPPPREGHTSGSGEGSMEHTFELMDTVLDLEKEKDAQAVEILKLKQRVKKLERKRKSSISHLRRRIYRQVQSSDDDLDEEDASEQGRKSDKKNLMFKDSDFDVLDDDMENVERETVNTATTVVSAVSAPVTTAGVAISTAEPRTPPTTAATAFIDEDLTIAQTLVKMRSEKAKEKGVAFRDVEETHRLTRSTTTLQPLPTIDPKDKGKGVLVEEEPEKPEKVKRRDQGLAQIESDAELAQRLHEEELAELDKAQKEKQKQEEATNAALAEEFDEIQARMDADHELAVRLTHEEQEKYTIKERATLLAEYFERRKKQLAVERYTHQQLKHKTLEELQKLYQKEQKWINDFKPMDFEEDGSNTKKASKRIKRITDLTSNQKSPKKSKVIKEQEYAESNEQAASDYEQEKEELRMWLAVVPDEDETVDPEILSVKYPIVDWESHNLYTFSSMLRKFNRQDLIDLHTLVMKRFEDNTPEGYNLLLWGDLKVMFEPNAKDEIWSNQQDWTLISWKLYENCGVHSLLMDGTLTCFNMLVEKRYPLIKEMLKKMLNWKLEVEAESTMAFELLKFIKSHVEE
ncbi:putative ribonuclease H-like domain-containing protein [Tanacetum coccineum]